MYETEYDLKPAKKVFSRVGFALCAILVCSTAVQFLWFVLSEWILGEDNWFTGSFLGESLGGVIPMYFVAIPIGLLILRKLPVCVPQDMKLQPKYFMEYLPICLCLMYCGSFLGMGLSYLLSGGTATNPVEEYVEDNDFLKTLAMVVIAPLVEEFVFRKTLIDRTRRFGEQPAVLLSALVFGLIHQNFYQFFYAFFLGLLFGYVYLRTGRLRYTIFLHFLVNFMGGVLNPWILSFSGAAIESTQEITAQAALGMMVAALYAFALIGFAIFGLVRLLRRRKQLLWLSQEGEMPKGCRARAMFLNPGMLLFVLLCLLIMLYIVYS